MLISRVELQPLTRVRLVRNRSYRVWIFLGLTVYCVCQISRTRQTILHKDLMQGKLFQRYTHLLYCRVLSLGGNVNTRRESKPDMGSIFHINNQWNIRVIWNSYENYQNYQNSILLTSSDTKQTLRHLFLFTNSAQRELVSICTQSIRHATVINFPCIITLPLNDFFPLDLWM